MSILPYIGYLMIGVPTVGGFFYVFIYKLTKEYGWKYALKFWGGMLLILSWIGVGVYLMMLARV